MPTLPPASKPRTLLFRAAAKLTSPSVRKWIYIDVDGTLTPAVAEYARQVRAADNITVLWSARGENHARRVAENLEALDAFDYIISKPAAIIDDQGVNWLRFVEIIHPRRIK